MLAGNAFVRPPAAASAIRDTTRPRPAPNNTMTPAEMDRVFGADRLQMATGGHVEVFREAAAHGVERAYTKRFLAGASGDFRAWTVREWRILDRLASQRAPVAKPLEFLLADGGGAAGLRTRDAGATVEQWATLVPLRRGDTPLRSAFEDCAHWWSLARHCLLALDAVHALGFVHLELKPDNVCIPWAPAGAGRPSPGQPLRPRFKDLALIDVAFSLLPEIEYAAPLPLLRQPAYDYQSPRLLHALEEGRRGRLGATRALDWRCDFFSLAGMLWRYLPELDELPSSGWTTERHLRAREFVQHLLDLHSAPMAAHWPHRELIAFTTERLRDPELAAALEAGTSFDSERETPLAAVATPATRLADPAPPPAPEPVEATAAAEGTAASAPGPLAEPQSERAAANSAASAPAPQPGAAPEPRAGAADEAEAKAGARPTWRARRKAARRRLALRAGFAVALVGAAIAAWWFGGEQETRFEMPSLGDLAERSLPASAAIRAPAVAAVTASAATARADAASESARADAAAAANDELAARAEAWRSDRLPVIAVAAERRLAHVLAVAARSAEFRRRGDVRAATRAMRSAPRRRRR